MKMKRFVSVALTVLMLLPILAGCGAKTEAPVTISPRPCARHRMLRESASFSCPMSEMVEFFARFSAKPAYFPGYGGIFLTLQASFYTIVSAYYSQN